MKNILTENQLRKIVNKVIRKKLNEIDTPKKSDNSEEKQPKNDLNIDVLKDTLKKGGIDNLATKSSGTGDRAGDAAIAGGVALGVTTALGGFTSGTAAATLLATPAAPLVIGGAIAAGLYYVFFSDTTITDDAVKRALDTTLYDRTKAAFDAMYDSFIKSDNQEIRDLAEMVNPEVVLKKGTLSDTEAAAIAKEIYDATQGGTLNLGIGTNKDEVRDALKKCKSYLGVSQVSKIHAEAYEGIFMDDGDLHKVFEGEFSKPDLINYVRAPIKDLPFIFINDKSYSVDGFKRWIEKTKIKVDEIIKKKLEEEEVKSDAGEGEEVSDYIEEIQKLINDYCDQNDLDYTPIKTDGAWGPRTNSLWKDTYLPHVLENHPVFSTLNINIGNSRWANISNQLIKTHPGYTSGQIGCYRFCKDALEGTDTLGKKEGDENDKPIKYYGGGTDKKRREGESTTSAVITDRGEQRQSDIEQSRTRLDGRLDYRNIKIRVEAPGGNMMSLSAAGLGDDQEFAKKFLGGFNSQRLNMKAEESFQMELWPKKDLLNKDKITGLGAGKTSGSRWFQENNIKDFKGIFIRHFSTNDRLNKIANLGAEDKRYKKLKVTVVMPKGVYTNVVNESRHRKSLLRKPKYTPI